MAFQYEIRIATPNTVTDDDTYRAYIAEQVDADRMATLNEWVAEAMRTFPTYSRTYEMGATVVVHGFDTLAEAESTLAEAKELFAITNITDISIVYGDITET